jgi:hypothetical protein
MNTLEKRVADALANDAVTSTELAALISELEAAIATADAGAEAARVKALDPLASPDAKTALEASQAAEFARDRLRTLLPRLRQHCQAVANQEQYDRWTAEFDRLVPRHDAAVEQLKSICEAYEPKLIAALVEAQAVDAEAHRLANTKPYHLPQANGDGRHLPKVELAARGLSSVVPGCSLMTDLKLPKFNSANELAWPRPQPSMAVDVAQQVAAITRHPGADWHKELEARNRAAAEADRERAAREAAEREQYFKEQQERARCRPAAAHRAAPRLRLAGMSGCAPRGMSSSWLLRGVSARQTTGQVSVTTAQSPRSVHIRRGGPCRTTGRHFRRCASLS